MSCCDKCGAQKTNEYVFNHGASGYYDVPTCDCYTNSGRIISAQELCDILIEDIKRKLDVVEE